jgi:hypothetical protein
MAMTIRASLAVRALARSGCRPINRATAYIRARYCEPSLEVVTDEPVVSSRPAQGRGADHKARQLANTKLPPDELAIEAAKAAQNVSTMPPVPIRKDLSVSFAFLRHAMMKIAYELAFLWLGETYLEDPVAHQLGDMFARPYIDGWDSGLLWRGQEVQTYAALDRSPGTSSRIRQHFTGPPNPRGGPNFRHSGGGVSSEQRTGTPPENAELSLTK